VEVSLRTGRLLALALACLPAAVFAAGTPVQQYLSSATTLYTSLEYERALDQVRRARALSPTPEEAVAVALLEGVLLFELGRPDEAQGAFLEALSLDPNASLRWKVSPKVSAAYESARRGLRKSGPSSPSGLTRTGDEGLPPARVGAIVAFVASAAAAAGGVACAVEAKQRYDALDKATAAPADAAGVRDSGKQLQLAAGVLAGVGVAALVAGAVLWGTGGRAAGPSVSVAVGSGGGQVILSGAFP
jgi:tetratricopeptide (TPR) repeat protein